MKEKKAAARSCGSRVIVSAMTNHQKAAKSARCMASAISGTLFLWLGLACQSSVGTAWQSVKKSEKPTCGRQLWGAGGRRTGGFVIVAGARPGHPALHCWRRLAGGPPPGAL